ncbi:hypothetical protein TNCT_583281 [Trichonephila clavata]|uniref:Uncharacterized protein n=1 Tax=Trichonephila clavata TaxID=2740835 RepID=A0A8X6H4C2_TRICU|nr:hypothetical protein TNCT_583281 [Trichonephila clavata]
MLLDCYRMWLPAFDAAGLLPDVAAFLLCCFWICSRQSLPAFDGAAPDAESAIRWSLSAFLSLEAIFWISLLPLCADIITLRCCTLVTRIPLPPTFQATGFSLPHTLQTLLTSRSTLGFFFQVWPIFLSRGLMRRHHSFMANKQCWHSL